MGSTCSVDKSAPRSPENSEPSSPETHALPAAATQESMPRQRSLECSERDRSGTPRASTPKRFVSVITDRDSAQVPDRATKTTPTHRPRNLSLDSSAALSSGDEVSLDTGGASNSSSFYSGSMSRISPKDRTSVSFVHSVDVALPQVDLVVPHDAQLASPRAQGFGSQRPRNNLAGGSSSSPLVVVVAVETTYKE